MEIMDVHGRTFYHLSGDTYYTLFGWRGKTRRRYAIRTSCSRCGKTMFQDRGNIRKGRGYLPVCSPECHYDGVRGPGNANWGGGTKNKRGKSGGHILKYAPTHPNARKGFVPEHRLVMEQVLGRLLEQTELVHHINCDPQDNDALNLVVLDIHQHNRAHASLEKCVAELLRAGSLQWDTEEYVYKPVPR